VTALARPRVRRRHWVLALVCVVVVAIGAVGVVVWRSIPDSRIAFLVDTSATEASSAVASAVGAAAQNTGGGDALSLRRFGGRCGDPHNTAQVVGTGAGHAARISRSVRGLATGGSATLESGVLAAIKDFSGHYPFRGRNSNRIIVITSRGTDACNRDQATVKKTLQEKVKAAGLHLDFRFVGYLTPTGEQANLTQLASAVSAPTPYFAHTPADLTATLKHLVIPGKVEVDPLETPTPTPAPLADGQHYAYVRGVDPQARIATIDPIQWLTGKKAEDAAHADGTEFVNDYYIRNRDKRRINLPVAPGAPVTSNIMAGNTDPNNDVDISLARLAKLVKSSPEMSAERPFIVVVTNGRISRLREIWTP
jgi:hypothetical protein